MRIPRSIPISSLVVLLLHQGAPATPEPLSTAPSVELASRTQCRAHGDLNRDGTPDVAVISNGDAGTLCVWLNEGGQVRSATNLLRRSDGRPRAHTPIRDLLCWDADKDGWPDLILIGASYEPVALFLNCGQLQGQWQGLTEAP